MKIEDITYSKNNTHIPNSYEVVNKQLMEEYIKWIIEERIIRKYPITRTLKSYEREWLGHNRLYYWNINKKNKYSKRIVEHSKSVDLEEPEKLIWRIVWLIIGR